MLGYPAQDPITGVTPPHACPPYFVTPKIQPEAGQPMLHCHDRMEIGYCYSGSGTCFIGDMAYAFSTGDIMIVYPGEMHDCRSFVPDASWRFVYPDMSVLYEGYPDREHLCSLTKADSLHGHICSERELRFLNPFLLQILHLSTMVTQEDPTPPYMLSLLACFLYETERHQPTSRTNLYTYQNSSYDMGMLLQPAIQYMMYHFTEPIHMGDLHTLCYISESHFRRCFTAVYGMSPSEYLHKLRIRYACSLLVSDLVHKDQSILRISGQCGYATVSSFNRQFLKIMGMTPSEYRSQHTQT